MKKNPLVIVLGLSAFFFVVFLAVAVGTVMSLTPGGRQSSKKLFSGRSSTIGVVEIKGVIMDSKKSVDQLDSFAEDPLIKAVIVRINSPGGSVAPSQEIYEAVRRVAKKKPVYASMSSVAASGGYYVACGAKKIYANAGTITGSIGVIMQFADASKLLQWAKVSPYAIKTGKFKDIGSPSREMREDERQLLQDMIDNVLGQFRRAVSTARSIPMDKVVEISDGRIFSGEQAKDVKLVDEVGGLNETVEAIAKEAGITGKPHLVYAGKKRRGFERFLSDIDGDEEDSESSTNLSGVGALLRGALAGAGADRLLGSLALPGRAKAAGPLFLLPFWNE
ncbi:MAG: signal peptide peptidase SppA [Deltaproteobacteria bacterium]|nr:signal peptide peptidase SppA [Deltaproteobacteria bacterium]